MPPPGKDGGTGVAAERARRRCRTACGTGALQACLPADGWSRKAAWLGGFREPWGQAQAPVFLLTNDRLGESTESVRASVFLSVKQTCPRGVLQIAGGRNK